MAVLKAVNLGLKFVLELAAFAALAWWGGTVGHGVVSVLVAIVLAAAVAINAALLTVLGQWEG